MICWCGLALSEAGAACCEQVPPREKKNLVLMPDLLDCRLDDNYQTRMICGQEAHNLSEPVTAVHLRCAMRNLYQSYEVVGVQERANESVCVLAAMMGLDLDEVRLACLHL
jgi:hypothetical protein